MITLISRWKLKNGCPPELAAALKTVADEVRAAEPDTLAYAVHLPAPDPLGADGEPAVPAPEPIPPEQQTEVAFFEIYKDAAAFSRHVKGPTFQRFLRENIKYFYEDPLEAGWPNTETEFLSRQSAFVRPVAE